MAKKIRAFFMRVDRRTGIQYKGYFGEIENTLRAKQIYVNFEEPGGLIQCIPLGNGIDLICHDEGKLLDFPLNRIWVDDAGKLLDIVVGNIMCVRHNSDGEFTDILESDKDYIINHLIAIDEIIDYKMPQEITNTISPVITLLDEFELPEWRENEK